MNDTMRRVAIMLAWLAAAIAVCPAQTAADLLQEANALYQQRRYHESLTVCDRALALEPTLSEAFRRKGWCRIRLHEPDQAVAEFTRAIEADPRNAMAYNGRGYARHQQGEDQSALADINRALQLNPAYSGTWNNLGLVKNALGDVAGAEKAYEEALRLNPKDTAVYNNLANLVAARKDHRRAVALYDRALELDPDNEHALRNRALQRYYLKDYDGAVADASRSLEIDPDSADACNNRGLALMARGDLAAARADFERALGLNPDLAYVRNNLAKVRARMSPSASSAATPSPPAGGVTPPPAAVPVSLPNIVFTTEDPCRTDQHAPAGLPWQAPDPAPVELPAGVAPASPAPLLDFRTMSSVQYNGAVSVAMEGMRLVYGEMTADEEERFQACWAPLFDFPTLDIIDYLNELNPLLGQFLAGREAFMRAAVACQVTMYDAALAVAAGSRQGYFDALASADRQAATLRALEAGLAEIARRIQALGNPPNPLAAKCDAGQRYRRSLQSARPAPEGPWILEGEWAGYSESDAYPAELSRQIVHLVFFRGGQNPMSSTPMRSLLGFSFSGGGEPAEVNWTQAMLEGVDGDELEYAYETTIDGQPATVRVHATRVSDELPPAPEGLRPEDAQRLHERQRRIQADWEKRSASLDDLNRLNQEKLDVALKLDALARPIRYIEEYNGLRYAFHLACLDWLDRPPADLGYALDWSDREEFKRRFSRYREQITAATSPATAPRPAAPSGPSPEEIAAREETIAFHRSMITLLQRNLQKELDELNRETDAARRKQLTFRAIQLQSDIQAEQDLITSYQTGQIVHTRSAFDVMAHEQFVHRIQVEAARADAVRRIAAGVERQIELLPWEQQAAMREKARAVIDARTIATGDVEKARRVALALNEQVQGYWQGVAAREDEKAIAAQEYEFYANTTVMAAGICVVGFGSAALATSFGETAAITVYAPHLIGAIYGGTTGTIAGGPVEGVKHAVSWAHPVGYMATSFVEGYQYTAADPNSTVGERLWAGVKEAGTGYLMGKAMQFSISLTTRGALALFGPKSRLFKPVNWKRPTVKEQFAAAKFQQDVNDARSLISFFKEKRLGYLQAQQQHPAGSPQLAQLEGELKHLAASLNSSYHCKWLLKYDTHPSVRRAFSQLVDQSYQEMMPDMMRRLQAQGYDISNLRFKPLRNASSAGSSSMDLDLALQEQPGMVIRRNGQPVSLEEFQRDAQRALNEAYHGVTGFSGVRSELALTTSVHSEAFANKKMLGPNADFSQFSEQEMASIGRVVNVKADKIQNDPVLGDIAKLQAKCRESAKEIENMLLKNLRQKLARATPGSPQHQQLQADIRYWEDMLAKFRQISAQTTNPYEILQIERSIRQDTGGKGSREVIGDLIQSFR